jgi:hypothetical protein
MKLSRLSRPGRRRQPAPAPFVVGVTRSGTTLLRLMLDSHPQLAVPPETHFALDVIAAFKQGPVSPERFVEIVTTHRRWPDFGLDDGVLRARVCEVRPLAAGPALRAFYRYYADEAGKPRWGDKTPGYLRKMATIEKALPEARFVHLIRDGRDVAVSITGLHFGPRSVPEAAHRWAKRIRVAREQGARVSHYMELRYEDLIRDPEQALRRICDFVELDWAPAMLDYHDRAPDRLQEITRDLRRSREGEVIPAEQRVGIHALASRPPQSHPVGRWRTEMSASDQAAFLESAGDLLAELGYPTG